MRKETTASVIIFACLLVALFFGSQFFLYLRGFLTFGTATNLPRMEVRGIPARGTRGIIANVYSEYPFNFKNVLLVSRGSHEGILVGQAVLYRDTLLGTVSDVFEESAAVQTIFDPLFKLPVRIGAAKTDALLIGGVNPRITLIPEHAALTEGDVVFSAGETVPFGTAIGRVRDITLADDKLFRKATLAVPYSVYEVKTVEILPLVRQK